MLGPVGVSIGDAGLERGLDHGFGPRRRALPRPARASSSKSWAMASLPEPAANLPLHPGVAINI